MQDPQKAEKGERGKKGREEGGRGEGTEEHRRECQIFLPGVAGCYEHHVCRKLNLDFLKEELSAPNHKDILPPEVLDF